MQLTPIASATPDGHVRIARSHRWIPTTELILIELAEDEYRGRVAQKAERLERARLEDAYAADLDRGLSGRHPEAISSRKAARLASKTGYRRWSYSIGDAVSEERSRSHELKKSLRRRRFQRDVGRRL